MNLWLDDRRPPPKSGHWLVARTLAHAQHLLRTHRFERISLDYDLTGDEKGLSLLKYMHENDYWPRYAPQIHSGNPEGSVAMRAYLKAHAPTLPSAPHAKPGPKPARLHSGGSRRYTPRPRHY